MRTWLALRAMLAGIAVTSMACGDDAAQTQPPPVESDIQAERCLVRIHGRSETGAPPVMRDGYVEVAPTGNGRAGDGFQWLYDTEERYREARDIVASWIDVVGCERAVLHGFSNGAAFVGKLVCRGETFDGRLAGVVIDDPVPDTAVTECQKSPDVPVALYWTGALSQAQPGASCADLGWTCDGETLLGIDAYAEAIDVAVQPSPHEDHVWYRDPPEIAAWLDP